MHKPMTIDSRSLFVFGRAGDPYFDHLEIGDHTNDFLRYVGKHHLREDATIFDVGANIGVTAAILDAAAPRGRLYCFEPAPQNYPHLVATIEANGLVSCHPHQIALGASSGTVEFLANTQSGSASHLALDGRSLGGSNMRVRVMTTDEFARELRLARLDFMKIDVEGFELDVLEGARHTLATLRPKVFLEFNAFTLMAYGNRNPRHVLEHLKGSFTHVYRFEAGQPREITNEASVHEFIHDNLIKRGCVDDLLCTFEAI